MKCNIVFTIAIMFCIQGFTQEYPTLKISNDIELVKLSEHAYMHISYTNLSGYGRIGENGLIYINNNKAFLFDTPWDDSVTKDLKNYIKDSLKAKVVGFVPNHWHNDCMGGLSYLQSIGVDSYANQMTIDIAKSKGIPVPANAFTDSLTLKLNDKVIKCYYLGAAHSLDNIVVWIPDEYILFAGCMVKDITAKGMGNTVDGDLKEWPLTIDKLMIKFSSARVVIPGHGMFGGLELVQHTKELLAQ
jgi:metallo-beta-lactamase class B